MAVNEDKLNEFLGKAIGDLGAAMSAVLVLIGDELGLYAALARERLTSTELADRTGTSERYVREWLANQAAGGYVEYDSDSDSYHLSEEQSLCLANPDGPVDLPGGYSVVEDLFHVKARAVENFRSGAGMEWGEHDPCLFRGTERFFRAGYKANLLSDWLPALDGVVEKLTAGGRAADIGCGHGVTTILMAQAFPNSEFVGIDYHDASIETAREHAAQAGVTNATFEVADATSYRGRWLRPHRLLRLPARYGGSGRRRPAREAVAGPRRPLPAGRAGGGRQCLGQPQSRGQGLLRSVLADLRARFARPAGTGAGCAGR